MENHEGGQYREFGTHHGKSREELEAIGQTVFVAPDGSFAVSVAETDHALQHYNQMVVPALAAAGDDPREVRAAQLGLMGACLAHAMGWSMEFGRDAFTDSEPFQELVVLTIRMYEDFKAQGLFDRPSAALS